MNRQIQNEDTMARKRERRAVLNQEEQHVKMKHTNKGRYMNKSSSKAKAARVGKANQKG